MTLPESNHIFAYIQFLQFLILINESLVYSLFPLYSFHRLTLFLIQLCIVNVNTRKYILFFITDVTLTNFIMLEACDCIQDCLFLLILK